MKTIGPGGSRQSGRTPARGQRAGRRLAAWSATSLLVGGGLAGASLLAGSTALADSGPDCPAAVVSGTTATVTCQYTGGSQYWTVPAGVTQATFAVYGAQGGVPFANTGAGGLGAQVTGSFPVTPGALLQVNVGQAGSASGAGTFGGGGAGGDDSFGDFGGSGGGESDVRTAASDGSYPLTDALLVAGGGGGGGVSGGRGGDAGTAGGNGTKTVKDLCGLVLPDGSGGAAGTLTAGGAGGAGGAPVDDGFCTNDSDAAGVAGSDGGLGAGGAGGSAGAGAEVDATGGGGGGGYYGGGGGGSATASVNGVYGGGGGGGGGSSYVGSTGATVTDGVAPPDDDAPNGEVIITYQVPVTTASPSCPASATADISADCYSASQGTIDVTAASGDSSPAGVDGNQAAQLVNGDYLEYPGIDFGTGSTQFDARVASGAASGVSGLVEVVLDNPDNTPVGSFSVGNTGGWSTWETIPANISTVTGTHTVYLEFVSGATGNPPFVSLHYFTFPAA